MITQHFEQRETQDLMFEVFLLVEDKKYTHGNVDVRERKTGAATKVIDRSNVIPSRTVHKKIHQSQLDF